jgi:hypothetical protein
MLPVLLWIILAFIICIFMKSFPTNPKSISTYSIKWNTNSSEEPKCNVSIKAMTHTIIKLCKHKSLHYKHRKHSLLECSLHGIWEGMQNLSQ